MGVVPGPTIILSQRNMKVNIKVNTPFLVLLVALLTLPPLHRRIAAAYPLWPHTNLIQKIEKHQPKSWCFLWKCYKKDIFEKVLTGFELSNSITAKPCISSMRSIVYHQNEVLHIIKPQEYTLMRDDIHLRWWYAPNSDDIPSLRLG